MKPRFLLATAIMLASVTLAPALASADAGEGAFRIGADLTVFDLYVFPDTASDATIYAGVLPSSGASGFAAHGAYQLTDQLLVGARATLGVISLASGLGSIEVGYIGLLPFGEFLLATGDISPFVGAHLGPQILFPEMGDAQVRFIAGGEFGVHIFLDPAFSISPAIWANFLYWGEIERAGLDFHLLVSMSGWLFGGGAATNPSPAPEPAAEPTPSYY